MTSKRNFIAQTWPTVIFALGCALFPHFSWAQDLVDSEGARISEQKLVAEVSKADIVYVGEQHGNEAHHKFQAKVLHALKMQGPTVLGVEYFSAEQQPILDRFVAGKIALGDFPTAIRWKKTWGHNWKAYKPLFALCQKHKIRIVGLNARRSVVRQVSKTGLAKLPVEKIMQLPRMEFNDEKHKERIKAQLLKVHPMSEKQLARYYEIFVLWDEAMAASVARVFLNDRRPKLKMLVVAGSAHVTTGTGIRDRVARRFTHRSLIIACGLRPRSSQWTFDPIKPKLY